MSESLSKYYGGVPKVKEDDIKGCLIRISSQAIESALSVVQKTEGDNIYFRLPASFNERTLETGTLLNCRVYKNHYEYLIHATVISVDNAYPNLVEAAADKVIIHKNRRQNKRYNVNMSALIKVPEFDISEQSIIKSISLSGLGIFTRDRLETGALIQMKVPCPTGKNEVLELTGTIIRANQIASHREYGISIRNIDEINLDVLEKWIYRLEKDEKAFVAQCLQ